LTSLFRTGNKSQICLKNAFLGVLEGFVFDRGEKVADGLTKGRSRRGETEFKKEKENKSHNICLHGTENRQAPKTAMCV
jgi:hypothetical protein